MSAEYTFIEQDGFGIIPKADPDEPTKTHTVIRRYTLTNVHNASVQLISWGAAIQSIRIPNKKGVLTDVVLGFDDIEGYLENRFFAGVIGRLVNRVAHGIMSVNDKTYQLTLNDEQGKNNLNGGFVGFDNVNWESYVLNKQVVMSHVSPADSEGFPGHMLTQVKYTWTDENQLHVNIRAAATEPTPTNITNYCLINLAGHNTGADEVKKHVATINADSWTFMDIADNLPTGAIRPVDGTCYDLRKPTQLTRAKLYSVPGGGYNHNLCINSPSCWCYRFHARIVHPESGRFMEMYSNHPGLQFYTGNNLPDPNRIYPPDLEDYACCGCIGETKNDSIPPEPKEQKEICGKGGIVYQRHGGIALAPQNYPNAVNIANFPSCVLYPGKIYVHDMTYKFGVISCA